MYKVIAIHTRNGEIERREVEEYSSVLRAFTAFGRLAATSNCVILIDEDQAVWARHMPSQLELVTSDDVKRFQLYADDGFDRERVR